MGDYLTAAELAKRLQVKPGTIREWTRSGLIPSIRITPKSVRYDADAVAKSFLKDVAEKRGAAK